MPNSTSLFVSLNGSGVYHRPEPGASILPLLDAMPAHWGSEFQASRKWIKKFALFCMHTTLDAAWSSIQTSEAAFQEYIGKLAARISNIAILSVLFMASITTLLTTTPPKADLFNFNLRACYLLLSASFSILIGSLYIMSTGCTRAWVVREPRTRPRMWMMLLILGYPTIAFFWATVALMASFLVAQLASHDHAMMFIGILSNFIPPSLPPHKARDPSYNTVHRRQ
ncbi:hypothetical protein K438DRAFT_1756042 [Mycena galopus ATCC 62051]|nr:hypothetical protein K438DRAFT_1756042 [Mycena galopus ATCC 62051]